MCRKWCEENNLLSPIYSECLRGGCWFCHNQGPDELRRLRKNYPEYWKLMLKWDNDSPVPFNSDGHTVYDYDTRFEMEEKGLVKPGKRFVWQMAKNYQKVNKNPQEYINKFLTGKYKIYNKPESKDDNQNE